MAPWPEFVVARAVVLALIAIAGLVAAAFLTPLRLGDKNLKYNLNPFSTYIDTIREMSKSRLLMVMMAWGYFYLLAGIALVHRSRVHRSCWESIAPKPAC